MSGSCQYDGCTVDDTGRCALERDPAECANRSLRTDTKAVDISALVHETILSSTDNIGAPVLPQPIEVSTFTSSRPLGLADLNDLMGTRYVNVVGILGDPESGKTACLASLYLLISHAKLKGWSFADSKSLTAFEEIARGARDWNEGTPPTQMTNHTEMTDERSPGFLHLRLKRKSDGRRIDLALPDLPGEWTQKLVSSSITDRFEFLKSTETIWIVLDGRALNGIERNGQIARVGQLALRLKTMLEDSIPRIVIVCTHHDLSPLTSTTVDRLHQEFNRYQVPISKIMSIAPFSEKPEEVPAGFGIAELIDCTVSGNLTSPIFWKPAAPQDSNRFYLNYRRAK